MVFEIDNLAVDFATSEGILHAVRGIGFHLAEGEILGIVGESGSGKSVTAHSLLGLLPGNGAITGGEILYRGKPVIRMAPEELRRYRGGEVGIIFQEPARSFDPIYSIGKALAETILIHSPGLTAEEVKRRSVELLEEVQVPQAEERLSNFPHQFSGGLLQRVMIALALSSDPKVLIADEPTTALDVTIQSQIIQLLLELKDKRGLAIIFISHNLALIGSIADRILVMYSGLILEDGPADRVLNRPLHPYTRALLDSLLGFGDHYTEKALTAISGTIPDAHRPEPGCPFEPRCWMVADGCREGIPEATTGDHVHRCLFPGVKESPGAVGSRAARGGGATDSGGRGDSDA